jgi:hypothetical protein
MQLLETGLLAAERLLLLTALALQRHVLVSHVDAQSVGHVQDLQSQ